MRRVFFVCALVAASTYAVNIDSMEPAELEFEDEYEFPEVDADGKQFMAKLRGAAGRMGNAVKGAAVRAGNAMDAAADRALVGTQNAISNGIAGAKNMGHRAAGAVAGGLANAAGAVGKYA